MTSIGRHAQVLSSLKFLVERERLSSIEIFFGLPGGD